MKTTRIISSLLLACLSVLQGYALIPTDHKQRLTQDWEFIRQDMGSIWEVMRPVPGFGKPEAVPLWQSVQLPHCFNAEDAVDPDVNYYQGPGWYRTSLSIDNPYQDGRTYLEFEGAGQKTEVYVYTTKIASHVGGYDEWKADITDAVAQFRSNPALVKRFGGKIPIAIRCDNSRDTEMIPSDMSDFNLYGGLYRYVNLVYVPATHFSAIQIDTDTDEKGKLGTVNIRLSITSPSAITTPDTKGSIKLKIRILDPLNEELIMKNEELPCGVAAQPNSSFFIISSSFPFKPLLWSPAAPNLYTCIVEVICKGDTVRTTEKFGFRHFRFEENGPFYLNGERLLLRGTHRHEDHAGVAAALTEEMMRTEMEQIKAMGANFIRLGHYQQSSIILRLCDELGLLVWEEIPWCRGGLGGEAYKSQARRMLTNMIGQHRNHPSIILWGLGNENDWPGDFETFNKDSIRSFMSELNTLAHQLDPSRPTVIRRCDFCKDIVDVYSPTIWAGWYGRRFRDYREMATSGMNSTPRFLHAEWGGDSHAGRFNEELIMKNEELPCGVAAQPNSSFFIISSSLKRSSLNRSSFDIETADRNGDWSESYIIRLFDWHLKEQETMPRLTGSLFWTFKDFSTPLRPENPIPYVNQKGVVQRDGTPKESYYVFQSYWSEAPMIHIYGHTWPVRWGKPDERKEILVYSNCPEVELFVNGTSQGRKKQNSQDFPAAGLHWDVLLQEGNNQIEAIGYNGKLRLSDKIEQEYQTQSWSTPAEIRLTQTQVDSNTVLVQAELVDKNGVRCLDAKDFIEFGSTDPKALLQNQGTARGSRRIQAANGLASICIKREYAPVTISAYDSKRTLKTAFISVAQ